MTTTNLTEILTLAAAGEFNRVMQECHRELAVRDLEIFHTMSNAAWQARDGYRAGVVQWQAIANRIAAAGIAPSDAALAMQATVAAESAAAAHDARLARYAVEYAEATVRIAARKAAAAA
jgi:hypothetical protein